jgi:hypothetical protein
MGYTVNKDGTIPQRCHVDWDNGPYPTVCKECSFYNSEYDLINQAIESARCRIYRLKQNEGGTLAHQVKSKNQQELMNITIKALEFYREATNV